MHLSSASAALALAAATLPILAAPADDRWVPYVGRSVHGRSVSRLFKRDDPPAKEMQTKKVNAVFDAQGAHVALDVQVG